MIVERPLPDHVILHCVQRYNGLDDTYQTSEYLVCIILLDFVVGICSITAAFSVAIYRLVLLFPSFPPIRLAVGTTECKVSTTDDACRWSDLPGKYGLSSRSENKITPAS